MISFLLVLLADVFIKDSKTDWPTAECGSERYGCPEMDMSTEIEYSVFSDALVMPCRCPYDAPETLLGTCVIYTIECSFPTLSDTLVSKYGLTTARISMASKGIQDAASTTENSTPKVQLRIRRRTPIEMECQRARMHLSEIQQQLIKAKVR
jgi:hypothetical protein